ncbi:MAG TPA: hypothetical protein VIP11_04495 [Gemmatimonadaceae bacterium]
MSAIQAIFGIFTYLFAVGVVFIGVPWAFFTVARTRRNTDEILRIQREILHELRRARDASLTDAMAGDEVANPPKVPFW